MSKILRLNLNSKKKKQLFRGIQFIAIAGLFLKIYTDSQVDKSQLGLLLYDLGLISVFSIVIGGVIPWILTKLIIGITNRR